MALAEGFKQDCSSCCCLTVIEVVNKEMVPKAVLLEHSAKSCVPEAAEADAPRPLVGHASSRTCGMHLAKPRCNTQVLSQQLLTKPPS